MTNEPIVMKESISYRSVQLLSQQVLQLEVLVEVGKITFSLSVKSCELLFLQFFYTGVWLLNEMWNTA